MSSEFTHEKSAAAATGDSAHTTEHRASGTAERRTQQHPLEVKIFGGSRSTDKRAGKVHGVGVGRGVTLFAVVCLVLAAWPVYQGQFLKAGSGVGYYFGYVGGVMMLLMLLYPVRKHAAWARGWGPLRYWFMMHMVFGIGGPTLVLFHSTFHVKSLNAGVALYSMVLVALSGVIGRFIYKRVHHGLYGRQSNLGELQKALDSIQEKVGKVSAVLIDATGVGEKLIQFRDMALAKESALPFRMWKFMTLGWRRRKLAKTCRQELQRAVVLLAKTQGWDKQQQDRQFQLVALGVSEYLGAVQEVTQFSAYEGLFRLWHILHTPIVWLLAISGFVHVIAINMY